MISKRINGLIEVLIMKVLVIRKPFMSYTLWLALIMSFGMILNSCENEVQELPIILDKLVITDYVYENPELFSEFGEVMQVTGVENLLRVRGPYTLMLPTNDAMQAYYQRLGVSSQDDIDMQTLTDFAYNHIFKGQINTGSIGEGSLMYKNGLGDAVACERLGTEILLNKTAIIIGRDNLVSNGYVHHIDHTLDPITDNIYNVLSNLSGYSIFTEGIDRSGLSDTLQIITFPYGNDTARTSFTLLAVPDTLYNREGIFTIDDLINKYSSGDDLTNKNNEFYRYMEYHCLSGTHYFSDFTTGENGDTYYLISYDNYINIRVEQDYKINKTDSSYSGFYYAQSNFPAKNGTIHTVNDLLPNVESAPTEIVFQVTDYFDLQQGSYYGNNYER
ncbi:MAG: fasciclin domain-containing protein, partial [Salinivirgaceae bacterium]|nr:fasciclin domain-containing protein [Salinivirgaceae bacterium]